MWISLYTTRVFSFDGWCRPPPWSCEFIPPLWDSGGWGSLFMLVSSQLLVWQYTSLTCRCGTLSLLDINGFVHVAPCILFRLSYYQSIVEVLEQRHPLLLRQETTAPATLVNPQEMWTGRMATPWIGDPFPRIGRLDIADVSRASVCTSRCL